MKPIVELHPLPNGRCAVFKCGQVVRFCNTREEAMAYAEDLVDDLRYEAERC